MYRLLLLFVIVAASLLAFVFFPPGQEYLPTREWIRQVAQGPFGWPIFLIFVAMAIGAFISIVTPGRRR